MMLPALLAVIFSTSVLGQSTGPVTGIIVDSSGAAVPDAAVRLHSSSGVVAEFLTGVDGRFEFVAQVSGLLRIEVTATGFSAVVVPVRSGDAPLRVILQPAPFFEAVNVTSSRTAAPRADPTATVTVFSATELLTSGALTLDDALKTVPGFTLFRRTSSRVSNPTAQGVTLRGLGGTGASRSLVLADGVPLNDAFGGWVYWDKLPQVAIDRVEVLRGSGSDLYGADAIGGVIQILTWHPRSLAARGLVEGGSLDTARVSLFGGSRADAWSYTAGGEWFTTAGYVAVARKQDPGLTPRGPIDTKLASTHRSGIASVEYQMRNGWHVNAGALVFTDNRLNGTPEVINDTASRQGTGQAAGAWAGGLLSARGYLATQGYDQTFSAVSSDRTSEDLNRRQRVPTRVVGTALQWVRAFGRHALLVGAEGKFIRGKTLETQLSAGRVLATIDAGGTQHVWSTYLQDTFLIGDRLTFVAGGHADRWHTRSQNLTYDRTLGSFNPRASFAYRVADGITLRGSAYKGFRAPTLNELYRGFRAGNTQTNPNEALVPERLTGGEGGLLATRGALSARVTGFWNVLDDVITNVTLSSTPQLITKQRANADKMRTAGVEVETALRLPASVFMAFSGMIVDARYKGDTGLRGNRVPQVPAYNLALNIRYTHRAWVGSGQLRMTGMQFEDDLNAFQLRRATVWDVFGSRALSRKLSAFVAIENVLDGEHDVGRTPILTIGLPRAARVGVHISLP
jgi:outer membrane cobalamin receptor